MKVQFTNFRMAIDNLTHTEAVIVADFSENYNCKHHEEIQAHHFGGSRQQVSMHTVVVNLLVENKKKLNHIALYRQTRIINPRPYGHILIRF